MPKAKYIVLGSDGDYLRRHEDWIRDKLRELINAYHQHLRGAEIAVVWMHGKNPDKDGHLVLGTMVKASEQQRELHGWDAVLQLNAETWEAMGEAARVALIDHELCHLEVSFDDDGEPKLDGHGKVVYRSRKHDLEEFRCIVERHGMWKDNIRDFVEASVAAPLFRDEVESVTLSNPKSGQSVTLRAVK